MSDKIEIDDAMIARCRAWFVRNFGSDHCIEATRGMLDATLNPPSKPEIAVTAQMLHAGDAAWQMLWSGGQNVRGEILLSVYLAMRKLEPQAERKTPLSDGWFLHRRDHGGIVELPRTHRRKDDPR